MSENRENYGSYRAPLTPGELLDMALKELEGATAENFRERIKEAVKCVTAAKNWIDGNLLFQEKGPKQ